MKRQAFFLLSFFPVVLASFSMSQTANCHHGLEGHVYYVSGNQMPSPEEKPSAPKGVKTTLYIYDLTNINQVNREGQSAFYNSISTNLVKKVETDENGHFKVKLTPGSYSLFVKKDEQFYSSQFDEKNNIHPVEVKQGKMTQVVFNVNYNAVY